MLQTSEILSAITNNATSEKYRLAKKSLNYYEDRNDITDYKIYAVDDDGLVYEDTTKSNIRISHNFLKELVDQKVSYFHNTKKRFILSDIPELQAALDERFDDDFKSEFADALRYASIEGYSYLYRYLDEEGKSCFNFAEGMNVVEIPAHIASDGQAHIIYSYVEKVKDNKTLEAVLDYTKSTITFYKKIGSKIELDDRYVLNPKPIVLSKPNEKGEMFYDEFDAVPFYKLSNNRKEFTDLKPIKGLIDDYDLMAAALSNNLQDLTEGIYVVKNYGGNDPAEFIQNVKAKKYVGVGDGGDFDIKTVDIPYEARKAKLELDKEAIYKFGEGFDNAKTGDGNITNIVIKSRYASLDMKVNNFEAYVRKFLKPIVKSVLREINDELKTNYKYSDVYIDFERSTAVNETETIENKKIVAETQKIQIDNLLNCKDVMEKEFFCKQIAEILDLDWEQVKYEFDFYESVE